MFDISVDEAQNKFQNFVLPAITVEFADPLPYLHATSRCVLNQNRRKVYLQVIITLR